MWCSVEWGRPWNVLQRDWVCLLFSKALWAVPVFWAFITSPTTAQGRVCRALWELASTDSRVDLGLFFPASLHLLAHFPYLTLLISVLYKWGRYAKRIKFIPVNPTILYGDTAKKRNQNASVGTEFHLFSPSLQRPLIAPLLLSSSCVFPLTLE